MVLSERIQGVFIDHLSTYTAIPFSSAAVVISGKQGVNIRVKEVNKSASVQWLMYHKLKRRTAVLRYDGTYILELVWFFKILFISQQLHTTTKRPQGGLVGQRMDNLFWVRKTICISFLDKKNQSSWQ